MGTNSILDTPNFDPAFITPEHVRGLSLGKVTEQFGTPGLYVRTLDTLQQLGLEDNELIQKSLQLGLALHADDLRTNGHYTDHLMRVLLHVLEDLGVRDINLIAAAPLHDSVEDHPKDLAHTLTGERPIGDLASARILGLEALARFTNDEVAYIVESVTNPIVAPGEDKVESYVAHTIELAKKPKPETLKLGDVQDNSGGNHATIGKEKQRRADEKYLRVHRIHLLAIFSNHTVIPDANKPHAIEMLMKAHVRAVGRLALLRQRTVDLSISLLSGTIERLTKFLSPLYYY